MSTEVGRYLFSIGGTLTSEQSVAVCRWGLLGIRHKGGGLWVGAKAGGCSSLVSCFPQLLLSPVTPIDAAVVHDDHHNGQLIPAMQEVRLPAAHPKVSKFWTLSI